MKILIVEDDFISRKILQKVLSSYGECDLAVDGEEALEAFSTALNAGEPYRLICLDIMLPKTDGQAVLQRIRTIERERGISYGDPAESVSIIMTTGLDESENVMKSFRTGCEGFVPKPLNRERLLATMREIGLIS